MSRGGQRWPAAALLLLTAACGVADEPPPEPPTRQERIVRLEAQIEAWRRIEPAWRPWTEGLGELETADHLGEDGLMFGRRKDRVLYQAAAMRGIAEPPPPGEPIDGHVGPLAAIVHFGRQLETLGVDFLLVPVPPRAAVYPDLLGSPTPLAPGEAPPLLDGLLREFYLRLERHGIEVVDLLPSFLEQRFQSVEEGLPEGLTSYRDLIFRRQDDHWSTHGAAVAARVVGERVRRYPWYRETVRRFGRAVLVEETVWRAFHGSIGRRMLKRDPSLPPGAFPQHRVRIEGEEWSFNDRTSPVTLLGDSFSLNQHGFPDHLLRELGYRVDTISVPGGNQSAQLKTLRLRGDRLAGKRLVIWETDVSLLTGQRKWVPVDVLGDG